MAEGIYNPLTRYGYMSPANNTTKACTGTTSFLLTSALMRPSGVRESTNSVYFADEATTGTAGQIVVLADATDTSLANIYTVPTFGDPSQYSKVEDMIQYTVNGLQRVFFAVSNTTGSLIAGNVGIATTTFGTTDPDWANTVHSADIRAEARLSFCLADNGFLYLLDGMAIHKIDGTVNGGADGIFTQDALNFIGSNDNTISHATNAVDAVDTRGRMWIAVNLFEYPFHNQTSNFSAKSISQKAGVYIWDRRTTVATIQDFTFINGVKEIKAMTVLSGQPACFSVTTDGYTELRIWNGNEFKVAVRLGRNAHPNYRRHSIYQGGDYIIWFGADGKIYFFGSFEPGVAAALYILGDMTSHVTNGQTFSTAGVMVPLNGNETVTSGVNNEQLAFYLSFSDTGGNHLKKWYPFGTDSIASNAQLGHVGNVYSLVQYLPRLATITSIDIYCQPLGAAADSTTVATLKFYANQSATPFMTKTVTRDDISKGYLTYSMNKSYVNAFQMEIEWSTSQTLGANDFVPSYAVLEYEAKRVVKTEG